MEFVDPRSGCLTVYNLGKRNPVCPDQTYIVGVQGRASVPTLMILGQEDPKMLEDHTAAKSNPYAMIRLSIFRLKKVPERYADLQSCLGERIETHLQYAREFTIQMNLDPGYYSVIAQLRDCREGVPFYIRFALLDNDRCEGVLQAHRLDDPSRTFASTASLRRVPEPSPFAVPGSIPQLQTNIPRPTLIVNNHSTGTGLSRSRMTSSPSLLANDNVNNSAPTASRRPVNNGIFF
jgi:hypothetical protein